GRSIRARNRSPPRHRRPRRHPRHAEAAGATESYRDHLASFVADMKRSDVVAEFQATMGGLLQTTEHLQALNATLKTRLAGASEQISRLQERLDRVQLDNMIDSVTGVGNRRLLETCLPRMIAKAEQSGEPLSLLLIDLDSFKEFNDRHGHVIGDDILRLAASALKQNSRQDDLVCRYGGDEFVVLLPRTSLEGAVLAGNKVRSAISARELRKRSTNESLGRLSVSIGAAQHKTGELAEALIDRADQWMYLAKEAGRGSAEEPSPAGDAPRQKRSIRSPRLVWQPAYECGEVLIDRQHRQMFDLVNELFPLPVAEDRDRRIMATIDKLMAHIAEHFRYEESVLQARGYAGTEEHRMIHAQLLGEARRLRQSLADGQDVLDDFRLFLCRTTVVEHMLGTDREFFSLFGR
ncbi:diguanylate cyclase, partial [Rhodoplanes elegans]